MLANIINDFSGVIPFPAIPCICFQLVRHYVIVCRLCSLYFGLQYWIADFRGCFLRLMSLFLIFPGPLHSESSEVDYSCYI